MSLNIYNLWFINVTAKVIDNMGVMCGDYSYIIELGVFSFYCNNVRFSTAKPGVQPIANPSATDSTANPATTNYLNNKLKCVG